MREEKKQSIQDVALKIKDSFSIRQFVMALIVSFGTMANIATDWISMGLDGAIFVNPAYWVSLVISQGSIVVIMLCVRSFMADKEESGNTEIQTLRATLSKAHCLISERGMTQQFDEYIEQKNKQRKVAAYTLSMQRKMLKAKTDEKRKELENEMLKGLEKIEYLKVKYDRIQIVEIFSRCPLVGVNDDNISDGSKEATAKMLLNKVVGVIAFGVLGSTLTFQPNAFGWSILLLSVIKLFQVAYGVYMGGSEGVRFVRGSLLSALETRAKFVQRFLDTSIAKVAEPSAQTTNPAEATATQS